MESTGILPTGEQSFPCMGGAVGTAGTLWPAPLVQKGRVFPQSRLAESGWGLLQTLTVITLTTGPRVSRVTLRRLEQRARQDWGAVPTCPSSGVCHCMTNTPRLVTSDSTHFLESPYLVGFRTHLSRLPATSELTESSVLGPGVGVRPSSGNWCGSS